MNRRRHSVSLVVITFLVAFILTVLPLPDVLTWLRPYWVAMVLIYWTVEVPDQLSMGVAFMLGLLLDLLTGTLAGMHALGLVIVFYIVQRFRLRMRFFPLWQQALAVGGILLNDRIVYTWIHSLAGQGAPGWHIFLAPVAGLLIWPWIFLLLDRARQSARTR